MTHPQTITVTLETVADCGHMHKAVLHIKDDEDFSLKVTRPEMQWLFPPWSGEPFPAALSTLQLSGHVDKTELTLCDGCQQRLGWQRNVEGETAK